MIAAVKFAEIEPEELEEFEYGSADLESLVEWAQAGDRSAFGELAKRFEGMVFAIALRRLAGVVGSALALGLPMIAVLMVRFILHPADFIGDVRAGAAAQMNWTAIFPFTPRLYVDSIAGFVRAHDPK